MLGALVNPKSNCPHVQAIDIDSIKSRFTLEVLQSSCTVCGDANENWFCLVCETAYCSRFVNAHMAQHNEETRHPIALSLSDASFWCYQCDSYITNGSLNNFARHLSSIKFPESSESASAGSVPNGTEAFADDGESSPIPNVPERPILPFTREDLIMGLQNKEFENVVVLTGAGISVAAGIPDFRTPSTGLYSRLSDLGLPYPEAVFQLDYFRSNPKPFYEVAKSFFTSRVKPVQAHAFIKHLEDEGVLLMNYTQNIDGLELDAGLPIDKLVQAHGHMRTAHCIDCSKEFLMSTFWQHLESSEIMYCDVCKAATTAGEADGGEDDGYKGLVKPDIVFFGEALPPSFHEQAGLIAEADLVIVMGTSLKVFPFAFLVEFVSRRVPIVLANRENPGITRQRFLFLEGDIEETLANVAEEVGWGDLKAKLPPVSSDEEGK